MMRPAATTLCALRITLAACGPQALESSGTTRAGATPGGPADATAGAATVVAVHPSALETDRGDDTCALLAGVELDAALGEAAAPPEGSGPHCDVRPADAASPASMLVHYVKRDGAATYAQQNAIFGINDAVPELGEEAIASDTRVHARAGDAFLRVQIVRSPMGPARQISTDEVAAIARQIARNARW